MPTWRISMWPVRLLRATATTQQAEIAVHSRPRYAAEIQLSQKGFEPVHLYLRHLPRSGARNGLTRARLQLAAYFFLDRCKTCRFKKTSTRKLRKRLQEENSMIFLGRGSLLTWMPILLRLKT